MQNSALRGRATAALARMAPVAGVLPEKPQSMKPIQSPMGSAAATAPTIMRTKACFATGSRKASASTEKTIAVVHPANCTESQ